MHTRGLLDWWIAICAMLVASGNAISIAERDSNNDSGDNQQGTSLTEEDTVDCMLPGAASHFECDIILTDSQRAAIEELTGGPVDPNAPQRAVTRREDELWPNGRVPYVLGGTLDSRARYAIQQAIDEYALLTCIEFVPRNFETDYVYFFKGSGCYSSVGRVGGRQVISIGSGCEYKGIVMHEMFHALGRWHEQSRPDRDLYVNVNYENMIGGVASNFFRLSSTQVKTQGVEYDYGSLMHYSAYAFSSNGRPTIEPRDARVSTYTLGQRRRFSARDLEHATALYCNSGEVASWSEWGSWSTCSRTCNGGSRVRTRTCNGGSSCLGSNIQEEACNTQTCQEPASWSEWGIWSGCSRTCGGGRQSRFRQCQNGNTCVGSSAEYRDCNEQPCPTAPPTEVTTTSPTITTAPTTGGFAGLRHEGCYLVLSGSGLFLLDGRSQVLIGESAFTRTDPVRKCAQAATEFSFTVMAVAEGYCISGNNRLSDYTTQLSDQCRDGKGFYNFFANSFSMDVYTITDPATFSSSDVPQRNASDSNVGQLQPSNHGTPVTLSTATILVTFVAYYLTI